MTSPSTHAGWWRDASAITAWGLVVFVPGGYVMWGIGAVMAGMNLLGGYVGARTAVAKGSRFVRVFFVVVVAAFVVKIGGSVLGLWT